MRSLNTKTPSILSRPVRAMGGFAGGFKKQQQQQQNRFQPYPANWKQSQESSRPGGQAGKNMPHGSRLATGVDLEVEAGAVNQDAAPTLSRNNHSINDNYCLRSPVPVARPMDGALNVLRQNFSVSVQQPVLCPVVTSVHFVLNVRGQSQKKDGSPSSRVKTNKFCEKCFLCRTLRFCPQCLQCPQCCKCTASGGSAPKLLANMVPPGRKPDSSVHLERRVHSPIQNKTPLVRDPLIISGYANPRRNLYLK